MPLMVGVLSVGLGDGEVSGKNQRPLGSRGRRRKKRRRNTGAGGNLLDAMAARLALDGRQTV